MKLEWDFNSGGAMGPNMLLRLGGHCVGHFYEDAHSTIDADEVREDIATRYNAHDALVAALERADTLDSYALDAVGGSTEESETAGEEITAIHAQIAAALALARGER